MGGVLGGEGAGGTSTRAHSASLTHASIPPPLSLSPSPRSIISTQPVVGFDWSPDMEGLAAAVCLDQTLRIFIVTKLNKL
jgi:hypothetical protein